MVQREKCPAKNPMARAGRHNAAVEFVHYAAGCRTACPIPAVFLMYQEGLKVKMGGLVGLAPEGERVPASSIGS
jgi:hypothetical protein